MLDSVRLCCYRDVDSNECINPARNRHGLHRCDIAVKNYDVCCGYSSIYNDITTHGIQKTISDYGC